MKAGEQTPYKTFVVKQGATFRKVIRFEYPLTGYTAKFYAQPNDGSAQIALLSTPAGPVDRNVSISGAEVIIYFAAAVTDLFKWTDAPYYLDLVNGSGVDSRKLRGVLRLEAKWAT